MTGIRNSYINSYSRGGKKVFGIDFYWNGGNRVFNVNEPD